MNSTRLSKKIKNSLTRLTYFKSYRRTLKQKKLFLWATKRVSCLSTWLTALFAFSSSSRVCWCGKQPSLLLKWSALWSLGELKTFQLILLDTPRSIHSWCKELSSDTAYSPLSSAPYSFSWPLSLELSLPLTRTRKRRKFCSVWKDSIKSTAKLLKRTV